MPKKYAIPNWVYVILALLALVPIVGVVLIGKYMVPRMFSATKATAALGKDDTIQYRGQTIQLGKAYADFDEYKSDPNNISANETERVKDLVATAPIAAEYPTREALMSGVMEIEFPGYGMTAFGEGLQSDGTMLSGFAIEIPRAQRDRILVFQLKNERYRLVDDFVAAQGIMEVKLQSGQLRYYDEKKQVVMTRPVRAK